MDRVAAQAAFDDQFGPGVLYAARLPRAALHYQYGPCAAFHVRWMNGRDCQGHLLASDTSWDIVVPRAIGHMTARILQSIAGDERLIFSAPTWWWAVRPVEGDSMWTRAHRQRLLQKPGRA